MKRLLLCFFIFSLLLPCSLQAAELKTLDANQFLALVQENKGKVIMVNFFATWCPPCRVEIPELVKLRNAFPEDRLFMLGLSVDEEPAPVVPFVESMGIDYPVYMADPDVSGLFAVSSIPHNVFYSPDGQVIISEPGMADLKILGEVVSQLLTPAK